MGATQSSMEPDMSEENTIIFPSGETLGVICKAVKGSKARGAGSSAAWYCHKFSSDKGAENRISLPSRLTLGDIATRPAGVTRVNDESVRWKRQMPGRLPPFMPPKKM